MKIVTIVGARPQFIKSSSVSRAIREANNSKGTNISEIIIHTGQHYDENMSRVFFEELEIPTPDYNLGVGNCSHGAMTGRMLEKIEKILLNIMPDFVLVYGDTNSTLAGALAAKKLNLKLAHVESGLRSFNLMMPEEQNRILTDRISDLLFCPSETAMINLNTEGVQDSPYGQEIFLVGDVMYDAALYYIGIANDRSDILSKLNVAANHYILASIHRPENTDTNERLQEIISALRELAFETEVILPIHPRTKGILAKLNLSTGGIRLIDPIGYLDMLMLEKHCRLIITDSGGMQKEAYFFCKPCITIRDETEWVELVDAGVNYVVGSTKKRIIDIANQLVTLITQTPSFNNVFYGDGRASNLIVETMLAFV